VIFGREFSLSTLTFRFFIYSFIRFFIYTLLLLLFTRRTVGMRSFKDSIGLLAHGKKKGRATQK
jgi:hypothetical protein